MNLYTHRKIRDPGGSNVGATHSVRTDSNATTLDKFLVSGNATLRKDIARHAAKNPKMVVPQKLMSVRKLIYEYEHDVDHSL